LFLINRNKAVKRFSIGTGNLLSSTLFDADYDNLVDQARANRPRLTAVDAPVYLYLPDLKNGKKFGAAMARFLEMKEIDDDNQKEKNEFKAYEIGLDCIVDQEGNVTVNPMYIDDSLPKDRITAFIASLKFDMPRFPYPLDHWRLGVKYFYFRKKSDALARKEKHQQEIEEKLRNEKRQVADSITFRKICSSVLCNWIVC
jgi:hypothetical protein